MISAFLQLFASALAILEWRERNYLQRHLTELSDKIHETKLDIYNTTAAARDPGRLELLAIRLHDLQDQRETCSKAAGVAFDLPSVPGAKNPK